MRIKQFIVKDLSKRGKPVVTQRPLLYLSTVLDAESYIKVLNNLPEANGQYVLELADGNLSIKSIKNYETQEPREPAKARTKRQKSSCFRSASPNSET